MTSRNQTAIGFASLLALAASAGADVTYRVVARTGVQAPGLASGAMFSSFSNSSGLLFDHLVLDNFGRVTFAGVVSGEGVVPAGSVGIWRDQQGTLELLSGPGIEIVGAPSGSYVGGIGKLTATDFGEVAAIGKLRPSVGGLSGSLFDALLLSGSAPTRLAYRTSEPLPGLPTGYGAYGLSGLVANERGDVWFTPRLRLSASTSPSGGFAIAALSIDSNTGQASGAALASSGQAIGSGSPAQFLSNPSDIRLNRRGDLLVRGSWGGTSASAVSGSSSNPGLWLVRGSPSLPSSWNTLIAPFSIVPPGNYSTMFSFATSGDGRTPISLGSNGGVVAATSGLGTFVNMTPSSLAASPLPWQLIAGTQQTQTFVGASRILSIASSVFIDDENEVVFSGSLQQASGLSSLQSILAGKPNAIRSVLTVGDVVPGIGDLPGIEDGIWTLGSIITGSTSGSIDGAGRMTWHVGVRLTQSDGTTISRLALLGVSPSDTIVPLVIVGQLIDMNPDPAVNDLRQVASFSVPVGNSADGFSRERNDVGQMVVSLNFTDSTQAIVVISTNACPSRANIAGPNQSPRPDEVLTADDVIVYLARFFAGDARADVAGPAQSARIDGQFTGDDVITFLQWFFEGC